MKYLGGGEYAVKTKESYWLTQTIIAHGSGSAGKRVHKRKTLGLALARTIEFTLTDSRTAQQTRQSIVQCKPSLRLIS